MSELKPTHAHIIISGLTQDLFLLSRLLLCSAISNSGDLNYAKTLFHSVQHPNLVMYNTMIRAFSQTHQPHDSLLFYQLMLRADISPNKFTFPFLLKSCSLSPLLGQQVHSHVLKLGLDADVFVVNNTIAMYAGSGKLDDARRVFEECLSLADVVSWTTMVTGYSNSGHVDIARQLFDEMPCKNVVSWNGMIAGYAQGFRIDKARELFDEMPEKNAVSWSAMISGYSQCGMPEQALVLFNEMIRVGVMPNEAALVSAVSACTKLRALEQGVWLHEYIKDGKYEIGVALGTALVDLYGKCGDDVKAGKMFKEMPVKTTMSWNCMIAVLALNGHGKQALMLFWHMKLIGPPPNGLTFVALLSGCSHSGLVDEGRRIFDIMTREYGIKPDSEHYVCMVDLLGRAGLIKEALEFVEGMPVKPHPGLWGALVGACRIHGDVELGEELGKHLVELEPHHSGRYLLLSNLFAAANRWDDAVLVRNLLKERKVLKSPGNSAVET